MNAAEEIQAAMETVSNCRLEASRLRQCKLFPNYVKWLIDNANAAERWAAKRLPIILVVLLCSGVANAQEDEVRVPNWPLGVTCSSLRHKSDGTWMLADIVVGPDGTRHYPNADRQSNDNRQIAKLLAPRCKTSFGTYFDKDHDK